MATHDDVCEASKCGKLLEQLPPFISVVLITNILPQGKLFIV